MEKNEFQKTKAYPLWKPRDRKPCEKRISSPASTFILEWHLSHNHLHTLQTFYMSHATQKNNFIALKTLAISCLIVFLSFIWQGNKGFSLWDEGFLWYGAQRVLTGETPILDFMAYDPGRYYWTGMWLNILGDNGIMNVRVAAAIFQALGLFVGLLLITRSERFKSRGDIVFWLVSAAILVVWMHPRHKLFDVSISLFLIGILTYLIENPVPKRYLIAGACIGLIAVFGRNHGIYGAVGSVGVIGWLTIKHRSGLGCVKAITLWSIGVVLGFTPIILMALLIPGFASAFWESIRFLFEQKATNLPLPVPWPWLVNLSATSIGQAARNVLIGLFFLGTLVFAGLSVIWAIYCRLKEKPVPPALVASAFLAVPYAHYAFSRADVSHLAQGIFPMLVGCLVILTTTRAQIKWLLAILLCTASFWAMHAFHPGWQCMVRKQCVDVKISGKDIRIAPHTANDIALLRQLAEQYAPNGQTFVVAPFWPGAYALLERRSPMWEIYALFPRTKAFENEEIARIKAANPGFVFLLDQSIDGRDELRFSNTHPLIYRYILDNFDPIPASQNPAYLIYKAKNKKQ